jgi:Sulfotransferase family
MTWSRLPKSALLHTAGGINSVLRHTVRIEVNRAPGHRSWRIPPPRQGRLLVAPVFILSAARSGSTLLRAILGSHSQLYGPPELPLKHLSVRADSKWIQASLEALRLTKEDLDMMLWDHVLADVLSRSGKSTIVAKTPSNVLAWPEIAKCWPDARFIFLLRHPGAAVASLRASWDPEWHHRNESGTLEEAVRKALRYMTKVDEARRALPGLTVHYEKLTADPGLEVRRICHFLGVPFEEGMLDYGRFPHGRFAPGLGDASLKIRSGRIQAATLPPGETPAAFRDICAAWGYQETWSEPGQKPGLGQGMVTLRAAGEADSLAGDAPGS